MNTDFSPQYVRNEFTRYLQPKFLGKNKDKIDSFTLWHANINGMHHILCRDKNDSTTFSKSDIQSLQAAKRFFWCAINDGVYESIAKEIFKEYKNVLDIESNKPLMLRDVIKIQDSVEKKRIKRFIESLL